MKTNLSLFLLTIYALVFVIESYRISQLFERKISVSKCSSFTQSFIKIKQHDQTYSLHFKKVDDSNENDKNADSPSLFERIKRFLPWNRRVQIDKSYAEAMPSTGMRYHLRLLNPKDTNQRHIITRILRYFPDITWETAESIVAQAINDDAALLRVMNSKVLIKLINYYLPSISVSIITI